MLTEPKFSALRVSVESVIQQTHGLTRWFEDIAGRHLAAVGATLSPEVVAAAQVRGWDRDPESTVAELLIELGKQ